MPMFKDKFPAFAKELPDVAGKVFAITGTTSGTGFAAAQTVAEHHGEVLLLNRPSSRAVAALDKLRAAVPEGKFVPIDCDLQDFASVRAAGKEIAEKYASLYCLANNAGIMAVPDEITKDGFEKQMQTNHLSHFLLTQALFPLLLASAKEVGDARIVEHSSLARDGTKTKTKDHGLEEQYFTKQEKDGMLGGDDENAGFMKGPEWYRYSQSKLANSVFAQALNDKLKASTNDDCRHVLSLAAHPGGSKTGLGEHLKESSMVQKVIFGMMETFMLQSAQDGAMGLIKCMMDARDNVQGGMLYGPGGSGFAGVPVALPPKPHEVDSQAKDMLWTTSEAATGVSFEV